MGRWIAVQAQADEARIWIMQKRGVQAERAVSLPGRLPSTEELIDAVLPVIRPFVATDGATPLFCAGVRDAPRVQVPCPPSTVVEASDPRLKTYVLPGLAQSRPVDATDSEIAQIIGCMAAGPEWDGVLCLPGARSLWVHVSAGEIVSFRSFLTPEILSLMIHKSSLAPMLVSTDPDAATFADVLGDAMSRPENLASSLAALQAQDLPPAVAQAQVAALLIGMELAAARPYWLGQDVKIAGTGDLAARYRAALEGQGVPVTMLDGDEMTLQGFIRAYEGLDA